MNRLPADRIASFLVAGLLATGCAVHRLGDNFIADTLYAATALGTVDDLDFEKAAAPAGLKALEAFHQDEPHHVGVLNALVAAYSQYAYAFLDLEAERIEDADPGRARDLRERARLLFLRARDYGLDGLDLVHPGFRTFIRGDPALVLDRVAPSDISLLYWTASAWAAAFPDVETGQDVEAVEAMMQRALILDDEFAEGSIHDYFAIHYASGPDNTPRDMKKAREHLARALELSGGTNLSLLVTWANLACLYRHDTGEYRAYLQRVLAFDVVRSPGDRMANELAQGRARLLWSRVRDCSGTHRRRSPLDHVGLRLSTAIEPSELAPAEPGARSTAGRGQGT